MDCATRWIQEIAEVLLDVTDLRVRFETPDGPVHAVNGLGFSIARGETLGIVGESGSGKSQSVLAMMGLLPDSGQATGSVRFNEQEILGLAPRALNRIRGSRIAMIFQDAMTSLNPYLSIATQMREVLMSHEGMNRSAANRRCIEMLEAVQIPDAASGMSRFPHEFSGGMRQRVMIAMALLCNPDLLIADEPTTALDVTVQAQIMALMNELQEKLGTAIILITHDMGVVAGNCKNVLVMYGGQVMEQGRVDDIFYRPAHPYTRALLDSVPGVDQAAQGMLRVIPGSPPDMRQLPPGCPFSERCEYRFEPCASKRPTLSRVSEGHTRACHLEAD